MKNGVKKAAETLKSKFRRCDIKVARFVLFCWMVTADVMKCAPSLSATMLPPVMSWWLRSLPKKALAPPESVTAKIWIGRFGMLAENALWDRNKIIRTRCSRLKSKKLATIDYIQNLL